MRRQGMRLVVYAGVLILWVCVVSIYTGESLLDILMRALVSLATCLFALSVVSYVLWYLYAKRKRKGNLTVSGRSNFLMLHKLIRYLQSQPVGLLIRSGVLLVIVGVLIGTFTGQRLIAIFILSLGTFLMGFALGQVHRSGNSKR